MRDGRLLPFQGARLVFVCVVMFCTLVVLVLRLYDYQFVQHDKFVAQARENAVQSVPLPAPRGVIYDRYGVALALNSPAWLVTVIPASLPDDERASLDVLNRLSSLIDVPPTRAAADAAGKKDIRSLQEMVVEGEGIAPYRPVVVKTDVDQSIAQQILEIKQLLPGVDVQWGAVRQYPTGRTTAQLVGYLGPIGQKEADELRKQGYNPSFERTGFAGVEASLNTQLAGERGRRVQKIDVAGRVIEGGLLEETPAVPGTNARLTIDLQLQRFAEQSLVAEIDRVNQEKGVNWTQSGVVIAMNPQTGEILAMVSWPTYDNSKFARFIDGNYYEQVTKDPTYPLINHAIGSTYPPGSTWKILTATAVDQEKVINPNQDLIDPGSLTVKNSFAPNDVSRNQKFVCWDRNGHGRVNLVKALAVSCDVYFYQVGGGNPDVSPQALRPGGLGIENLDRYAAMYGIGEQTFVELPGTVTGNMPNRDWKRRLYGESWSTGDTYNAAFGQGYVIVTPLQLLNVAATIANGGTQYQPTVINSFVDSENNVLQPFKPHVLRTVVLPTDGSPAVLHIEEDMKIKGPESLACTCELDSEFTTPEGRARFGKQVHDPSKPDDPNAMIWVCDPAKIAESYRQTVMVDRDVTPVTDPAKKFNFKAVDYTVFVPFDYDFTDGICNKNDFQVATLEPARFASTTLGADEIDKIGYQPPFVDKQVIQTVQKGMQEATKVNPEGYTGTAGPNSVRGDTVGYNVGAISTAGKTGTAEYCDNVAAASNLCQFGAWPAHAWFLGYAPSDKPEIAVVGFVYHGNEGSVHAMPVVRRVTACYFKLKDGRKEGKQAPDCSLLDDVKPAAQ